MELEVDMSGPPLERPATGRAGVTAADAEAWLDDVTSLGDDAFFGLNRYVFVATKPVTPLPASPG